MNPELPDWEALALWDLSVFPLRPRDKKPLGDWKRFQRERANADLIAHWARDQRGLNAAVATGAVSGVIVLDTDSDEAEAEVQRRGVPKTPTVKTAKGRHRYFKHPGFPVRNFAGKLPGCDLRGDGGYVVAAGSTHPSGVIYRWEVTPDDEAFAPVPEWLLSLIRPPPTAAPARSIADARSAYAEKALDGELSELRRAAPGQRNHTLNRCAFNLGQLVGANALERATVERHLLATAGVIGLDEREAAATIQSGLEKGISTPRAIPERRNQSVASGAASSASAVGTANAVRTAVVADLAEARTRKRRHDGESTPVLAAIDPIVWQGQDVPDRQWIVPNWIPDGTVTALYGDGGVGKSLLAQQLLTACALGERWVGLPVKPCRAMGFFCEDTADELHRRQSAICDQLGVELGDLENVRFFSRVADDNVLMTFDADGTGRTTPLYDALIAAAQSFGAQLLVVDTLADVFGGNENIRNQARQFISALARIAKEINGAVVLCAHPSIDGISRGHGFAGSTAWSNTVRSRLYLTRPEAPEGEAVGHEERLLTRMKANYAATGEAVRLRWSNGALISDEPETGIFGAIERQSADTAFLECLDQLEDQGRSVSDSVNAGNYAPKTMRKMGPARRFKERDLAQAMERLFAGKQIKVVQEGRHKTRKIVRGVFRGSS